MLKISKANGAVLTEKKKKIILISPEQEETQVASFFRDLAIDLSSSYDQNHHADYLFIVDDYLAEIKQLPRIQTKNTISSECLQEVRALIDGEYLESPEVKKLLDSYFSDKVDFDLVDLFSKDFKETYCFKIHDYLNIGYFVDTIIVKAYNHKFDFEQIRDYLNHTLPFALREVEKGQRLAPIDVSFSYSKDGFAIQIALDAPQFNMNGDFNSESITLNDFFTRTNYFNANYFSKKKRLQFSSLWFKDEKLKNFKSYFLTEISTSNVSKSSAITNILDESDDETKYTARQSLSENQENLFLKNQDSLFITTNLRSSLDRSNEKWEVKRLNSDNDNDNDKLIQNQSFNQTNEIESDTLHVQKNQKDLDKENLEKQIVRMKILINKMKDEIINLRAKAIIETENEEHPDAKIAILENELFKAKKLAKYNEDETLELKSRFEVIHAEDVMKIQSLENRMYEIRDQGSNNNSKDINDNIIKELQFKNKSLIAEVELANRKISIVNQNIGGKENDSNDVKKLEEQNKILSLELKKIEHKLKFAVAKFDEAQKVNNRKAGPAKDSESYIKQLGISAARLDEAVIELGDKKKDNIKLKQDNLALATRVSELEKKLGINKKIA